jgi:hypothetical protein
MTLPANIAAAAGHLQRLVEESRALFDGAATAVEVLEARDLAAYAYDQAKIAARLLRAKGAHDELIERVRRAQANAVDIEALAKRRLADEYDAAQERGEVGRQTGRPKIVPNGNDLSPPTAADIGLSRKQIHEARQIRDAEKAEPGIVRRTLDTLLEQGQEPTKAAMRQAVVEAAMRGLRGGSRPRRDNRNPLYKPDPQFAAMAAVVGCCRTVIDRTAEHGAVYILGGFLDDGMRGRNLTTIRECRDVLTALLEVADAEETRRRSA